MSRVRCDDCGHEADEHGPSGCAADDEAAMSGCLCERTTAPRPREPIAPLLGPGGTLERGFA
jgi:hypothetical protein